MPIKEIRNQPVIRGSGVPLIARVRKGESQEAAAERAKKEGKNRFTPQDLPYLRFDVNDDLPATVGNPQRIADAIASLYGDEPTSIHGLQFMTDDVDTAFQTAYERWITSKSGNPICQRRCDGVTTYMRNDENGIDRRKTPCQCDHDTTDPAKRKQLCAATGRLVFWLPEVTQLTGVLGEFMLITHGTNDIINITSTLNMVKQTVGRLRGISFTLYRKPVQVMTPDGKPTTKNLVYLGVEQAAAQHFASLAAQDALALTTGNGHAAPPLLLSGTPDDELPEPPIEFSVRDEDYEEDMDEWRKREMTSVAEQLVFEWVFDDRAAVYAYMKAHPALIEAYNSATSSADFEKLTRVIAEMRAQEKDAHE